MHDLVGFIGRARLTLLSARLGPWARIFSGARSLSESLDVFVTGNLPSPLDDFSLASRVEACDQAEKEDFLYFIKREQAAIAAQNGQAFQEEAAVPTPRSRSGRGEPKELLSKSSSAVCGEQAGDDGALDAQPDECCLETDIVAEEAGKKEGEAAGRSSLKAEVSSDGHPDFSFSQSTESRLENASAPDVQETASESAVEVSGAGESGFLSKSGVLLEEGTLTGAGGRSTRRRVARCRLAAWALDKRPAATAPAVGLVRGSEGGGKDAERSGHASSKDKEPSERAEEDDRRRASSREDKLARATERRLGVHYSRYDRSWVARYTHGTHAE